MSKVSTWYCDICENEIVPLGREQMRGEQRPGIGVKFESTLKQCSFHDTDMHLCEECVKEIAALLPLQEFPEAF